MILIRPSYEILTPINRKEIYQKIEKAARTCYKSENNITDDGLSAEHLIKVLMSKGHEAMLEHVTITFKFICDRGVSHELVRHRIASFAQESTRFCNYTKGEITFVIPPWFNHISEGEYQFGRALSEVSNHEEITWFKFLRDAEWAYKELITLGQRPEQARGVLPNCVKTEVVCTMNIRELRYFFRLRALGEAGKPHPQMYELAMPFLHEMVERLPLLFFDLTIGNSSSK